MHLFIVNVAIKAELSVDDSNLTPVLRCQHPCRYIRILPTFNLAVSVDLHRTLNEVGFTVHVFVDVRSDTLSDTS